MPLPSNDEIQQPVGQVPADCYWNTNCTCGHELYRHTLAGYCTVCDAINGCRQYQVRGWVAVQ